MKSHATGRAISYDGNRFNRTAATAPLFNYLAVIGQLALGVAIGSLMSGIAFSIAGLRGSRATGLLQAAVAAIMTVAALLAALGKAWRSLRIRAAEALRAETPPRAPAGSAAGCRRGVMPVQTCASDAYLRPRAT